MYFATFDIAQIHFIVLDKIWNLEDSVERRELELFLRNIQQAVRKYTLSELNETIGDMVHSKAERNRDKHRQIAIVLDVVCKDFNVSRDLLLTGRGKGKIQQARKFAYCLLHHDLELPIRYIANDIFSQKWHTSVMVVIKYHKSLNCEIKPDREFIEKLSELRKQINGKIQNNDTI